jgi:hypothetical protein
MEFHTHILIQEGVEVYQAVMVQHLVIMATIVTVQEAVIRDILRVQDILVTPVMDPIRVQDPIQIKMANVRLGQDMQETYSAIAIDRNQKKST